MFTPQRSASSFKALVQRSSQLTLESNQEGTTLTPGALKSSRLDQVNQDLCPGKRRSGTS